MTGFLTFLENCFQGGWAERVGWTLVHSVWQIAAIAGAYAIAALVLRNRSASSRYVVGCVAMLAMLVLPMLTYVLVPCGAVPTAAPGLEPATVAALPPIGSSESPAREGELADPRGVAVEPSAAPLVFAAPKSGSKPDAGDTLLACLSSSLRPSLPWATVGWLAGVLLLSLRPVSGWLHVRRLQRRGLSPLADSVRHLCNDLMRRLRVNRTVRFARSALVEVPTVVGCLRPLVLLPASAITGLTSSQLELILAHELAHVRRHDYLVNLAQMVIETLLFYHPGTWWISRQIRCERENCCDDCAVALSGNRAGYVRALARLEQQRSATPVVALAATEGSLLARVRRLCGQPASEFGYRSATAWLAGLVAIGTVAAALAMQMPGELPAESEDAAQAEGRVAAKDKKDGSDILWGEAVEGIRLGIRPAPTAKASTRMRHGDWLRYEVWIKNESDQPIHVPRDPRDLCGPNVKDSVINVVGLRGWASFDVPLEELDKAVLTLGPQKTGLLLLGGSSQAPVRPAGTKPGRFGPAPLALAPGRYPCLAELDLHYLKGGVYVQGRGDGKNVHLRSETSVIEVLPAARLQVCEANEVAPETKRDVIEADPNKEIIRWSPSPGVNEDLLIDRDREPLLDEDDILDAAAVPALDDERHFDLHLQLTAKASQRLARAHHLPGKRIVLHFGGFVTSPKIAREIDKGKFVIAGRLTKEQAEGIVQAIKARIQGKAELDQRDAPDENDKPPVKHTPNAFFTARVVDAETGKPIEKFIALAGTSHREDIGWQWQPHTIREFTAGQMQWPPPGKRGYKEQVLRIEAKGYAPYHTPLVKRLDQGEVPEVAGAVEVPGGDAIPRTISGRIGEPFELVIRLKRDPGVRCVAVLPNGKAAGGAQVAIAMAAREVRIADGRIDVQPLADDASLRDRWDRPLLTTSDEQGQFTLPAEIAPAAVIITHAEGVAALDYADLPSSRKISLAPWGSLDGRVMWSDKPGGQVKIDVGARTAVAKRFHLVVACYRSVVTDDQGRFRVEKLPPGLAQVSHVITVPGKEGSSYRPVQFINVAPGAPTKMVFGGRGRPVIGKLVGATSYEGLRIRIAPNAPYPGFLRDPNDVVWPAYGQFLNSPAGRNYVKGNIKPNADGVFHIDNVPPETYQLFVTATDADGQGDNVGYAKFTIETIPDGTTDEPHVVGEVTVRL